MRNNKYYSYRCIKTYNYSQYNTHIAQFSTVKHLFVNWVWCFTSLQPHRDKFWNNKQATCLSNTHEIISMKSGCMRYSPPSSHFHRLPSSIPSSLICKYRPSDTKCHPQSHTSDLCVCPPSFPKSISSHLLLHHSRVQPTACVVCTMNGCMCLVYAIHAFRTSRNTFKYTEYSPPLVYIRMYVYVFLRASV